MAFLDQIVDMTLYNEMLEAKYIKEQSHPKFPSLTIVNYTDSCMWDQKWNDVTLACRGIIFDKDTLEVYARPFSKFFNYEQEGAPQWSLEDKVMVQDKLDGSLGILYLQLDGTWAVATRGSFNSDQAQWASEVWEGKYSEMFTPNPNWTYLFEIIYPENRIVVNYDGWQDLVFLAAVDIETGHTVPYNQALEGWPGPIVPIFEESITLEEALRLPERKGFEGFVLLKKETDERIKIKYEEYKTLHRYLTNTTPKHVWEVLSSGEDPSVVFAAAPDEFHEWLRGVVSDLQRKFDEEKSRAEHDFGIVQNRLSHNFDRKQFALDVEGLSTKAYLFKLLDARPIDDMIWKNIKPTGDYTFRVVSSDAD